MSQTPSPAVNRAALERDEERKIAFTAATCVSNSYPAPRVIHNGLLQSYIWFQEIFYEIPHSYSFKGCLKFKHREILKVHIFVLKM